MSPAESPSAESSPATAAAPPVTAVFGAGAVGCYFGARLAEAGVPVTLIGRPAHVAAIKAEGLAFESGGATRRVPIRATSDAAEGLAGAQFVMFCVKTLDTESAARQIAPLLAPGATVLSMQNGVDNAERMRSAAAVDAMAAVVYVGASMPGPGHLRHAGRGDLVIGEVGPPLAPRPGSGVGRVSSAPGVASAAGAAGAASVASVAGREPGRAGRIAALFEAAGVRCVVADDVRVDLWNKLIINCAYNAISALTRQRYGRMVDDAAIRALMRRIVAECTAVAAADGVALPPVEQQYDTVIAVGHAMAPATSSTSQDIERGRKTEIDALNGHVARRAEALGVAAPVNQALYALIRLRQADLA